MPGVLGSRSYFKKRFDKRKDPQSQNRLAARLKPFLLRRTKSQVAKDLPPRTEEEVYAKMEGIQSQLYKAELRRIQQALLGLDSDESVKKNSFAILQGLMRLRQICCHPGLVDPKYAKEDSAKMTALFYLLDQLREDLLADMERSAGSLCRRIDQTGKLSDADIQSIAEQARSFVRTWLANHQDGR